MKKTSTFKTIKRLLKYVTSEYKGQLAIVLVSIIISALVGVLGVQFIKYLIDDFITPLLGSESPDLTSLLNVILIMGVIYLIGVICTYIYNRLMINISQGVLKKIRSQMFSHMQTLPIRYFDSRSHGEIMSTYTNDVDTLMQMLSQSIPQVFSATVSMVAVLCAMFATNIYLTLVVLAMVVSMIFVSKYLGGNSSKFFVKQQEHIGQVNGYIEEMMEGQKVVKVFNYEEESKKRFDELNDQLCESMTKANMFANILMPCIMNIGNIGYVLVAVIGGILSVNGILTIGSIAAFLQYVKAFTNPLGQVSQQMNFVIMALAGAGRIFELMDEQSEQDEGYVTLVNAKIENGKVVETEERTGIWAWKHPHKDGRTTYTRLRGQVEFENVQFGYEENKRILHDITLSAKEGQKVSFVGATGAGKTTITNLINRFYDIQDGKIRYDRINIRKIKKDDLRRSLGMVLQDTSLFTGTIKDNIKYGKLNATDEEVYKAAKLSNADRFIKHLPHGYDTVITGNGEGLSQGQRQLLSIARAALNNPPVLILDEATSSIDTRTEKIVQEGMDKLMKGRTVFVIAHRLSTIKNSDVIMVLDHGRIIERGNHEELIAKKGTYYGLYTGAIEID
ncbi:MAG TPA: ABC transporter ATP-binding protein [Candidatus Merdicola faecigallinarum]|uniref:ABC transporter ATP-binding protein n=1 Tax=Candidatus Merdicola faecigallinarum TaxID=2840862 RepID=A0A9D1M1E1_9FIRM|nr:ABC transporter ATP-binding protein [Candidatus Merdicola faecigallinarum]